MKEELRPSSFSVSQQLACFIASGVRDVLSGRGQLVWACHSVAISDANNSGPVAPAFAMGSLDNKTSDANVSMTPAKRCALLLAGDGCCCTKLHHRAAFRARQTLRSMTRTDWGRRADGRALQTSAASQLVWEIARPLEGAKPVLRTALVLFHRLLRISHWSARDCVAFIQCVIFSQFC